MRVKAKKRKVGKYTFIIPDTSETDFIAYYFPELDEFLLVKLKKG